MRAGGVALTALVASAVGLAACGRDAPRARPNLVLISLDTTRADHLGCYGYGRPTSPNIDALAADGVVYTRAYTTSSWTLPAHASLFTGRFPSSHGVRMDPEGPLRLTDAVAGPPGWDRFRARGLAADERTLAELLAGAGYATGAVVAGPWLKRVFGLDRGFAQWDDAGIDGVVGRRAAEVTRAALAWLGQQGEGPFFLFLNYYDPHGPYGPPEPFDRAFREGPVTAADARDPAVLGALYDAEIGYMDHHLGVLLDRLRALGLYDDAWIVVTADHGELLGEHGAFGHGSTLTEPEVRIPLVVKYPAAARRRGRSDAPVQLVDVPPMLLEAAGVAPPPGIQGAPPPAVGHPVVAEVYPPPFMSRRGSWRMILDGDRKFLWNGLGRHALYDLEADPAEDVDLRAREPERARALERALDAYLAGLPRPGAAAPAGTVDEETRRALEGLGYLPPAPTPVTPDRRPARP